MASGPHHPVVPMTQAQMIAQHNDARIASEKAKIRSRKPTDKTLPDGLEDILVDPDVATAYKNLRDFERRLDATMTRKRLDIKESKDRHIKVCAEISAMAVCGGVSVSAQLMLRIATLQDAPHLDLKHSGGPILAK